MKKFLFLIIGFVFVFGEPLEDLPDYTSTVTMKNIRTGFPISVTDNATSWNIRQIELGDQFKQKDKLYKTFPFGWVQFYVPGEEDVCFSVPETSFGGYKSCSGDLKSGKLETVFSIMPTDNGAVQIRSLAGDGSECLFVYQFAPTQRGVEYGLKKCVLTEGTAINENFLIWILPEVVESTVIPQQ